MNKASMKKIFHLPVDSLMYECLSDGKKTQFVDCFSSFYFPALIV